MNSTPHSTCRIFISSSRSSQKHINFNHIQKDKPQTLFLVMHLTTRTSLKISKNQHISSDGRLWPLPVLQDSNLQRRVAADHVREPTRSRSAWPGRKMVIFAFVQRHTIGYCPHWQLFFILASPPENPRNLSHAIVLNSAQSGLPKDQIMLGRINVLVVLIGGTYRIKHSRVYQEKAHFI